MAASGGFLLYWQRMDPRPYILIVDDHPEIRNSVARYLTRNGMDVATAENAADMDVEIEARTLRAPRAKPLS